MNPPPPPPPQKKKKTPVTDFLTEGAGCVLVLGLDNTNNQSTVLFQVADPSLVRMISVLVLQHILY